MIIPWAKLGIYAAVAAILIAFGAGATYKVLAGKLASQQASIATLTKEKQVLQAQRVKDQKLLQVRGARLTAAENAASQARSALTAALSANREWADQPVPQEVQDALTRP